MIVFWKKCQYLLLYVLGGNYVEKKFFFIWIFNSFYSCFIYICNFRPLYYYDIVDLNIEASSDLSLTSIKSNYSYIIDYLNKNNTNKFKLPTLPSSNDAIKHFIQVKQVLKSLNFIFICSIFLLILTIIITCKLKQFLFLKIAGIMLITLPLVFLPLSLINFDNTFTIFHSIVFHNSLWLFDPLKDPVILMLPQKFFMHCFLLIIILSFTFGVIYLLLYRILLKNLQCHDNPYKCKT